MVLVCELVTPGENGMLVGANLAGPAPHGLSRADWQAWLSRAPGVAKANRNWVAEHAVFAPCVARLLAELRSLSG